MPDSSHGDTRSPNSGYSLIPDGLWYCGLSHGAVRLLGWLWQDPSGQGEIDIEGVRDTFGSDANALLTQLAFAGYLDKTSDGYALLPDPWEALAS